MKGYDAPSAQVSKLTEFKARDVKRDQVFAVTLINTTFHALSHGRIKHHGEEWGEWFPIPITEQNCFDHPAQCLHESTTTNVLITTFPAVQFELQLISEPDENGRCFSGMWTITPDANLRGQAIIAVN